MRSCQAWRSGIPEDPEKAKAQDEDGKHRGQSADERFGEVSREPSTLTTRSWQMMPPTVAPFHAQNPTA